MTVTVCPTCRGDRTIVKPKMALSSGKIGTVNVEEVCKTCSGVGHLSGFKPPV